MFLTDEVGLAQNLQGQPLALRATECALVFLLQALEPPPADSGTSRERRQHWEMSVRASPP